MTQQYEQPSPLMAEGTLLDMDPDIRALGDYLAQKRGLTFIELLEHLITREAARGKLVEV